MITEVGYQMDLYLDTKERGFTCEQIECRDFGGAPGPKKAIKRLLNEIQNAVERWRTSL